MIQAINDQNLTRPGCAIICGRSHADSLKRQFPQFAPFDISGDRSILNLVDAVVFRPKVRRLVEHRLQRKGLLQRPK